jgi:hypothetical protein
MKRTGIVVFAVALLAFSTTSNARKRGSDSRAAVTVQSEINPSCSTPHFPEPTALSIDKQCGNEGNGGKEAAQNTIKNNFCPTGNTPTSITLAKFKELQDSVENFKPQINFGPSGPTTDRSPLTTFGEGHLVTLKAFVFIARQEGGESVNCKGHVDDTSPLNHDIHISFVESASNLINTGDTKPVKDQKECTGVVGELSPHHRPASWTAANVNKLATAKVLVRVTGQQFFDSSHVPCKDGAPVGSNPKRISLWEIHPIYQFEVCTGNCSGAGTWQSLDQWLAHH